MDAAILAECGKVECEIAKKASKPKSKQQETIRGGSLIEGSEAKEGNSKRRKAKASA